MTELSKSFREHTYIRRRGRITPAQNRGLAQLPNYAMDVAALGELPDNKTVGIEIGFGMGHALLQWAQECPDWQLFGIELYQPGIGALVDGIIRLDVENLRVIDQPAQEVAAALQAPVADEIRIFFPDPWPKKRHHKRRLIQPEFVQTLARITKPGGQLRLATDWAPYAQWMRECFEPSEDFMVEVDHIRSAEDEMLSSSGRETTNFERRGERLGHQIHDLIYTRRAF